MVDAAEEYSEELNERVNGGQESGDDPGEGEESRVKGGEAGTPPADIVPELGGRSESFGNSILSTASCKSIMKAVVEWNASDSAQRSYLRCGVRPVWLGSTE